MLQRVDAKSDGRSCSPQPVQAAGLLRARRLEHGATAVEYGLMLACIALVIFGAVGAFGLGVEALFSIPAGVLNAP